MYSQIKEEHSQIVLENLYVFVQNDTSASTDQWGDVTPRSYRKSSYLTSSNKSHGSTWMWQILQTYTNTFQALPFGKLPRFPSGKKTLGNLPMGFCLHEVNPKNRGNIPSGQVNKQYTIVSQRENNNDQAATGLHSVHLMELWKIMSSIALDEEQHQSMVTEGPKIQALFLLTAKLC